MTATSERVRVGIVGAGGVGERHARVITGLATADVVGIADPDPRRAGPVAAACGVPAFPDARALVGAVQPDALYVCVPPYAHGDPEMLAVEHGLALFVEKPLAADLATAERLAAAIAGAGLVTATGYHWRYLDTVRHARELLEGRSVGFVSARWLDKVPPPAWWTRRDRSGGQVVEQATHLIDLVRHLAGEIVDVTAHGASVGHCGPAADVDEATAASFRLAGGGVGTLTASCLAPAKHATVLDVAAAGLALELSEDELAVHDGGGIRRLTPRVDARRAVDAGFADLVLGRAAPDAVCYGEALRTHRVGCAIAASAGCAASAAANPLAAGGPGKRGRDRPTTERQARPMSEPHQQDDPTVDGPSDDPETIAARQAGRAPGAGGGPPGEGEPGPQHQPDAIAVPEQDDDDPEA